MLLLRLPAALFLAAWPVQLHAHTPSETFLSLTIEGQRLTGEWDIALRDLQHALGLDTPGASSIGRADLRLRQQALALDTLRRLSLKVDGKPFPLRVVDFQTTNQSDGEHGLVEFAAENLPAGAAVLELNCRVFFALDPQMHGVLRIEQAGNTTTATFNADTPSLRFKLAAPPAKWRQLLGFVGEGIGHIWTGYDHLLFLIALLLPAVLCWQSGAWTGVAAIRPAFINVIKIVTAFTVAHSLTLALATLEVVRLPSRGVESAIALSVLVAALNNVWAFFHGRSWSVAFVFGLIHGFGFATALADWGLAQGTLALALVGFNLGVELGQVAIVGIMLPLAYRYRNTAVYQRFVLRGGSAVVTLIAFIWVLERAFGFKVLPF